MLKTTKTLPFQLKQACKANEIFGRLIDRGGGGEGKNQTPSNQKGLQDQKARLRTLPKKKDHGRVERMPTYKKVLHAGVQSTPLQGTQLTLPFTIAFNLGNPDLLPSGLASA